MYRKLSRLVVKSMNIDINPFQVVIYCNIYIIKLVYFRCRIIALYKNEEIKLKRIYEVLLLLKIGFSKNFPRTALYSRKSTLGIRLMLL